MVQEKLCNMSLYMCFFIYIRICVCMYTESYRYAYICIEGEQEQRKMEGSLLADKANE